MTSEFTQVHAQGKKSSCFWHRLPLQGRPLLQQDSCISSVLWTARLDMFSNSFLRTGLFVCKQDSSGIKCLSSIFLSVGTRTTSTLIRGDKQKTMDDLDGPSFLTSLYWLFGKGYFQTTHQMQVKIHKNVVYWV